MSIDPTTAATLTAQVNQLLSDANTLMADLNAAITASSTGTGNPPPPPPPPPNTATIIDAPNTTTLTDAAGNVIAFTATPFQDNSSIVWGYKISVNGVVGNQIAALLALVSGVVYGLSSTAVWSSYSNGAWIAAIPSPVPAIASLDKMQVMDIGSYIFDANGNVFMFANHPDPTYGAEIVTNGNVGNMWNGGAKLLTADAKGAAWAQIGNGIWFSYVNNAWTQQVTGPQ